MPSSIRLFSVLESLKVRTGKIRLDPISKRVKVLDTKDGDIDSQADVIKYNNVLAVVVSCRTGN